MAKLDHSLKKGDGQIEALREAELAKLRATKRIEILHELQDFLVNKVREYHNRQRIRIDYDPAKTTWKTIFDLLAVSREAGKDGPVAQYLVGAKLALRFSDTPIQNESYSTADDQLDRPGDFFVEDTVFHVTVAPMPPVYHRCKRNIDEGLRVYLLVPSRRLTSARQNAEDHLPGRISVESIESFVSQNLEEMSSFSKKRLARGFRHILETYNSRVNEVETDKSILIDVPRRLR